MEIPIIKDNVREETEAFMFYIEMGEIKNPELLSSSEYVNASYVYNIYEAQAIIWIHGPNDIPKTEFVLWNKQDSTKYESSFIWKLDEPSGNITIEYYSIYIARLQEQDIYDFDCSVKIHCESHTAFAGL